jgi:hypothetical protein
MNQFIIERVPSAGNIGGDASSKFQCFKYREISRGPVAGTIVAS